MHDEIHFGKHTCNSTFDIEGTQQESIRGLKNMNKIRLNTWMNKRTKTWLKRSQKHYWVILKGLRNTNNMRTRKHEWIRGHQNMNEYEDSKNEWIRGLTKTWMNMRTQRHKWILELKNINEYEDSKT